MAAFDVVVITLTGQEDVIKMKLGETVGDLRTKVGGRMGRTDFWMIYSGKLMDDQHVFTETNQPSEFIHIVFPIQRSMAWTWSALGAAVGAVGAVTVAVLVVKRLTHQA